MGRVISEKYESYVSSIVIRRVFQGFMCLFLFASYFMTQPVFAQSDFATSHLEDFHRRNNCGVFVGVSDFVSNRVYPLKYAANDAIAQAWAFVVELKLIPPHNCEIVLSVNQADLKEPHKSRLAQLKQMGVRHTQAIRKLIQDAFKSAASRTFEDNLLVFSISSHGFHADQAYVMAYDSDPDGQHSHEKGITIDEIERLLKASKGKKLLLVDACRESMERQDGTKALVIKPISLSKKKSAYSMLASCGPGQYSYEDPTSEHGLFTKAVLEGLKGQAAYQNQITLSSLERHTVSYVAAWTAKHQKRHPQIPKFTGMQTSASLLLRRLDQSQSPVGPSILSRSLSDEYELLTKLRVSDDVLGIAFNRGQKVAVVTEDGVLHIANQKKILTTQKNVLKRGRREVSLQWAGEDRLILGNDSGQVNCLQLNDDGSRIKSQWQVTLPSAILTIKQVGNDLMAGLANGELHFLTLQNGQNRKATDFAWTLKKPLKAMTVSSNGDRVAAYNGRAFQCFKLATGEQIKMSGKSHISNIMGMAFDPMGDLLVTDRTGRMARWSAASQRDLVKRGAVTQSVKIRSDGLVVLATMASFDGAGVHLIRDTAGNPLKKQSLSISPSPRTIGGLSISESGEQIGFGSGKTIYLYRTVP